MTDWLITEIWAKGYDGLTVYPNPETGEVIHVPPDKEPKATEEQLRQLQERFNNLKADMQQANHDRLLG